MSKDHHPRLRSGLPDGPANGIAELSDRLMSAGEDTQIVVVGVLERDGYLHSDSDHVDIPFVRFVSIDELDAENAKWARELLSKSTEGRRLAGQLEIDMEPGELAELMAEFSEFADDIGQSVDALKADFAEYDERTHGKRRSPEGTDPQTIREYLATRRLEDGLPARVKVAGLEAEVVPVDDEDDGSWDDDDEPGRAITDVDLPADVGA